MALLSLLLLALLTLFVMRLLSTRATLSCRTFLTCLLVGVVVILGGKPAKLISPGQLRYSVMADDLQEDAKHGVVLQINVQR